MMNEEGDPGRLFSPSEVVSRLLSPILDSSVQEIYGAPFDTDIIIRCVMENFSSFSGFPYLTGNRKHFHFI